MRTQLFLACAALGCCSLACGKRSQTSNSSSFALSSTGSLSGTAGTSASPDNSNHPTAPVPANPRDIAVLFHTEAEARPSGTIRTEDAFAAFRRDGIELTEVKQHLARPYGARYCVGALSSGLVAMSVCEYISPDAAKTGTEVSRKIPLANREIRINQATSLTVRELEKTPAADALSKRLFESFAKI